MTPMLGRLPHQDDRDGGYPMTLRLGDPLTTIVGKKMWRGQALRLDQGALGACVGFTGANWLGHLPMYNRVYNNTGLELYAACKRIDLWPNQEGSNDHFLAKVLVEQGRIERYLWAQTPGELRLWVATVGPVMVGTLWYSGMFNPEANGQLRLTGTVVGGHEWLVTGYDPKRGYRLRNSWGPDWGLKGEAWIDESDLYRLVFQEGGDALGAVERRP